MVKVAKTRHEQDMERISKALREFVEECDDDGEEAEAVERLIQDLNKTLTYKLESIKNAESKRVHFIVTIDYPKLDVPLQANSSVNYLSPTRAAKTDLEDQVRLALIPALDPGCKVIVDFDEMNRIPQMKPVTNKTKKPGDPLRRAGQGPRSR